MGGVHASSPSRATSRSTWPPARASATESCDEDRARGERERALERRSVGRLRALVAVLSRPPSLVAAGLTAVAANRTREAERLADRGTVAGLTGAAVSHLSADPDLSVGLRAPRSRSRRLRSGEPVPSETVEALHWAMQEAGVEYPVSGRPDRVSSRVPSGCGGSSTSLCRSSWTQPVRPVDRHLAPHQCLRYLGTDGYFPSDTNELAGERRRRSRSRRSASAGTFGASRRSREPRSRCSWGAHQDPRGSSQLVPGGARRLHRRGPASRSRFVGFPELDSWITAEEAEGDPPDLAVLAPRLRRRISLGRVTSSI